MIVPPRLFLLFVKFARIFPALSRPHGGPYLSAAHYVDVDTEPVSAEDQSRRQKPPFGDIHKERLCGVRTFKNAHRSGCYERCIQPAQMLRKRLAV
jgi:hypothetical protein